MYNLGSVNWTLNLSVAIISVSARRSRPRAKRAWGNDAFLTTSRDHVKTPQILSSERVPYSDHLLNYIEQWRRPSWWKLNQVWPRESMGLRESPASLIWHDHASRWIDELSLDSSMQSAVQSGQSTSNSHQSSVNSRQSTVKSQRSGVNGVSRHPAQTSRLPVPASRYPTLTHCPDTKTHFRMEFTRTPQGRIQG